MDILWETYLTPRLINSNGLQLLRRYDHHLENMQAALLEEVIMLLLWGIFCFDVDVLKIAMQSVIAETN